MYIWRFSIRHSEKRCFSLQVLNTKKHKTSKELNIWITYHGYNRNEDAKVSSTARGLERKKQRRVSAFQHEDIQRQTSEFHCWIKLFYMHILA